MKTLFTSVMIGCAMLALSSPAAAHRLDEYLQATRLSIGRDRINLEVDLTPGVEVAGRVLALIDTDRDGKMSSLEEQFYAQRLLDSLELAFDGRPISISLVNSSFPQFEDMAQGTGTIRLHASATFPQAGAGTHRVYYRNAHQSEIGAYLVNALVPEDKHIQISQQSRDYAQHEVTVEYAVSGPPLLWSSISWLAAGLALMCGLLISRRTRRQRVGGVYVMPPVSLPAATLDRTFKSSE